MLNHPTVTTFNGLESLASHRLAQATGSHRKRSFFAARRQFALYSLGVSYCCCVVPFPLGELVWISGKTVRGWRINTVRSIAGPD
jgi:hypothetical protein